MSSSFESSNQPTAGRPPVASSRSLLSRLIKAPEAGLVLVLAALMLLLTIVGGIDKYRKPKDAVTINLPAGTQSRVESGTTVISTDSDAIYKRLNSLLVQDAEGNLIVEGVGGSKVTLRSEMRPSITTTITDGEETRTLVVRPSGTTNTFLNFTNLFLILVFASTIAIMSIGMTGVIAMGGIDLSVGSIYGLSALYGAMALQAMQKSALGLGPDDPASTIGGMTLATSLPLALIVCCGVGALAGLFNGVLIVGLRVHPFVITLGTMAAYRGWIAIPASAQSISDFPNSFTREFFKSDWWGVTPMPVIFMLATAAVGMFVLSRTVFGRRIFAIGGNETAAVYAGIPVGRTKIMCYTAMGALSGLAACVALGFFGAASPNDGNGYELQVIAAAVIGGTSLAGGRGTALGAVLGAILVQLLSNGMLILKIDSNYERIVMGGAIVLAVVMDQLKSRLMPLGK